MVLGFLFLFSAVVWAQDTASIVGTITDTSGAVIPNAKIVVSNPERGFTRDLISNSAGEYTAARIPIGNYVVTVEVKGFQKLVRSGITLEVGQTLRVDLQLPVGQPDAGRSHRQWEHLQGRNRERHGFRRGDFAAKSRT